MLWRKDFETALKSVVLLDYHNLDHSVMAFFAEFFENIDGFTRMDISKMIHTALTRPGYPLITVSHEHIYKQSVIKIKQARKKFAYTKNCSI